MNIKSKKILLTGGTGFLGSVVVRLLASVGYSVTVIKRSSSDLSRIKDLLESGIVKGLDVDKRTIAAEFSKTRFDVVIHIATSYGRNGESIDEVRKVNFDLPMELLTLAIQNGSQAFINSDTFFELDDNQEQKDRAYILTKKDFLRDAQKLAEEHIKLVNLRIEHIYGPDDNPTKLFPVLARKLKAGLDINFTEGMNQRDFIYVDDVSQAFLATLKNLKTLEGFEEFGIGTGKTHTVREFVERFQDNLPNKGTVHWGVLPYPIGDSMFSRARLDNNFKINWRAETSLEDGVRKTAESYTS